MKNKNENFSVAVIATMSSGKSTTLNAMLGVPLLPSKNEACTATVCKIEDIDGMKGFRARAVKKGGETTEWENIKCEDSKLDEWNSADYASIEIQGDFPHIDNYKHKIRFYDTPGPNNSTDRTHSEITNNILENSDYSFVVCVMNASQFGVDDEQILLANLLKELNEKGQKTKIVFVVNKIDQLDIEAGEKPIKLIDNIKKYLNGIGFNRPNIIPVMSLLSLEIREILSAHQHKKELLLSNRKQNKLMRNLKYLLEFKNDYLKASMNTKIKSKYLDRAINQEREVNSSDEIELGGEKISIQKLIEADIITGIPLLEEMLEVELLKDTNEYYKTNNN